MNQKSLVRRIILFGVALLFLNENLCSAQLIDTTNDVTEEDGTAIADSAVDISVDGLRIGNTANGSMDVTGGLEVTHSGTGATGGAFIGFDSGTTGTATISGVNSRLTGQELSVGHFGNGELSILAGGVVTNVNGQIARQATGGTQSIGTATVSGAGSHWNNTGTLFVGINGDGTLNVESGGLVSSDTAVLGLNSGGSMGTATVTGAGSHWNNSGDMFLGFFTNATSGTLNIENDGEVTVGGTMTLFEPGTVNFSGGRLDVGTLDLDSAPSATENFNMTGGRLVVDTILGDFKQEGGVLAPGDNSIGITNIGLDLDMIAGMIEFEIGGAALFDQIDVGGGDPGTANLDGIMDIDLTGYSPVDGDAFQLFFTSGGMISLGSSFAFDFLDAGLTPGLAWDTSAFGSSGIISVTTSAVPEPTSFAMFGVACSFMVRRRKTGSFSS